MKATSKFISVVLMLALCLGVFPAAAFAQSESFSLDDPQMIDYQNINTQSNANNNTPNIFFGESYSGSGTVESQVQVQTEQNVGWEPAAPAEVSVATGE